MQVVAVVQLSVYSREQLCIIARRIDSLVSYSL